MEVTNEQFQKIEEKFLLRCKTLNIKFKSKEFYQIQQDFFIGAMSALAVLGYENAMRPIWTIYIQTNREIIEYKEKEKKYKPSKIY